MEMTQAIIRKTINGIFGFLDFTVESGDDYEDKWLPTLDTSLRVSELTLLSINITRNPPPPTLPFAKPQQ